jgi:uncharacterized membrane protein YbhN (UPF0104 family)
LGSILLTIFSLGLISFFVAIIFLNKEKYLDLLDISTQAVVALLLISALFPLINGAINLTMLKSLGASLSLWDGSMLAAASSLTNLLPVAGGLISKGVYLKLRYKISYSKFFGAILASFVCFIAVNGMIGFAILVFWALIENQRSSPILLVVFLLMSASLFTFWLPFQALPLPAAVKNRLEQVMDGWTFLSRTRATLVQIIVMQTSLMLFTALRYWIAFRMLSQVVSFSQCILFAAVSVLEQIVNIAPGGLGIREAIFAAIASALHFDVGISIVAVELDRLVSTFVIILLGSISSVILAKHMSKLISENQDVPAGDAVPPTSANP